MIFLLLLGVPVALGHLYLWRRLVVNTTLPRTLGRRIGTVAIIGAFVMLMSALVVTRRVPPEYGKFFAWPGFVWLAVLFYLAIALGVAEIPRRILLKRATLTPVAAGAAPVEPVEVVPDPSRRLFIARSVAIGSGVAAGGVVGYGMTQALGDPQLLNVPVTLNKLRSSLSGFRIAVVSDIHLGPLLGRSHTERIVRMINEQQADMVAIVGDLVDGTVAELGEAAAPLRDLVSKHGSFFVTGNHEYFSGHEQWIAELDRLGVNPLRNEGLTIAGGIEVVGVNDVTGKSYDDGPDFGRALAGRNRNNPVVLLSHQPVQVADASSHGVDLQLSGHTHGGQMAPFNFLVPLQQPSTAGLSKVDDTWLYTSRGAGFWGPPVRVGAPPDITMIELRSAG
ncbi:metallophosphoesterase [Lentzea sp. BCCO 10_0061]|uniref:Metallophosphoesterase n=1 Tax=Lentzea sokolovensis TaxID=3095429 RepID=A0ABU4UZT4_9PSEU|nr:metallophosphoesterase [Lentzea sp. BCCO 10_0061]MDX8145048.1 metallophosphoesterase [Lentzea sp. BCCO 10_0061]